MVGREGGKEGPRQVCETEGMWGPAALGAGSAGPQPGFSQRIRSRWALGVEDKFPQHFIPRANRKKDLVFLHVCWGEDPDGLRCDVCGMTMWQWLSSPKADNKIASRPPPSQWCMLYPTRCCKQLKPLEGPKNSLDRKSLTAIPHTKIMVFGGHKPNTN